jgi:hypothetical protein
MEAALLEDINSPFEERQPTVLIRRRRIAAKPGGPF